MRIKKITSEGSKTKKPETVAEALDQLMVTLSLSQKTQIAKMPEDFLIRLHLSLGRYIRNQFLYPRNERLLESCRQVAMDKYLHWDQASAVIISELWKRLQESHKMRVIKIARK